MQSPFKPPRRILVPVDYEPRSLGALRHALVLARELRVPVDTLYVWAAPYAETAVSSADVSLRPQTLFELARERCAEQMRSYVEPLQADFPEVELEWFIESGQPREKVFEHAERRGCDLIVMGTHARTGPTRWWLGSVAEYVVRHAACPVLVVPQAASTGDAASSDE